MVDNLESQIETARLQVSADSVSMSVSELTNLYREKVLLIQPEFQRLFRWTGEQKSKLIESILLGIPLPSLFVAQSEGGTWELVDGLQRVSTLLELQGALEGADGMPSLSTELQATKFLPGLDGMTWDGRTGSQLSDAHKLDIRLARLDIKVIKRTSDQKAKFDLFQRLNSFGSHLTPQEIRSAMIAGTDSRALSWVLELASNEHFRSCVTLASRLKDEQYDLELVLRFLMLHGIDVPSRGALVDFPTKLDDWSIDLASEYDSRAENLGRVFQETFRYLAMSGGEDLFRKWDPSRKAFRGAFLNTAYEVIAIGAGALIAEGKELRPDPQNAARELSGVLERVPRFATGLATADRLVKTLPLGRRLMANPPATISADDF